MSLLKNFQQYSNQLTALEIDCFHKILNEVELEPGLTIASLAEHLNVSTTTIFRMVKKLNYKTFMEFRYDLLYHRRDQFNKEHVYQDVCETLKKEVINTMDMLRHQDVDHMVKEIVNAKNILICSSGMNKYIAKILAVKLSLYGLHTIYPDDHWFLYLEANNLTKDDVVIVLSRSGNTQTLIDVMKNAKFSACKIILVTEIKNSPMAELSDYILNVTEVNDEGYDIDSRLHIHIAIEYLLREIVNQCLSQKKYL